MNKFGVSVLVAGFLSIAANVENSLADADNKPDLPPKEQPVAESYALPITPPLHQGDTGLCWMYATLSMLETKLSLSSSRIADLAVARRDAG